MAINNALCSEASTSDTIILHGSRSSELDQPTHCVADQRAAYYKASLLLLWSSTIHQISARTRYYADSSRVRKLSTCTMHLLPLDPVSSLVDSDAYTRCDVDHLADTPPEAVYHRESIFAAVHMGRRNRNTTE